MLRSVNWLVVILLVLFTAAVIFVYFSPDYNLYLVKGQSMEPTINTGDMVITGPTEGLLSREVKPGTIVTYMRENSPVTHRVIAVEGNNLITKGDAVEDPGPGGVGDIKDSTSNDNDDTALPGMTSDDLVDTQIYKGLDLDEGGDCVDSGMPSNCAINVTMSVWFKSDDAGSIGDDSVAQRLITQLRAITSSRFALGINNDRLATYWYESADNVQEGTTTLTSTSWYYATVTYNESYVRLYLNGIEEKS